MFTSRGRGLIECLRAIRTAVVTVAFTGIPTLPVGAQTLGPDEQAVAAPAAPESLSELDRPSHLPRLFLDNTRSVLSAPLAWGTEEWTRFSLASAAVIGTALLLDNPVREAVLRNRTVAMDQAANHLEPIGSKYALGTAAGFYLVGWAARKDEVRATGADALSASLVSGLLVTTLKYTLGRARPYQELGNNSFKPFSGRESFPSGHTTEGFTVASVIAAHYPDTWVQITAYGLATLGGLSRIEHDVHWTSDVLAGALIGTTIGRAVTWTNQRERARAAGRLKIALAPDLRPGYRGLQLGLVF